MKLNIQVCIKISNSDLSIEVSYIVCNLDFYDMSSGFWYRFDLSLNKVFSPFFLENTWSLLEEGMGHWVNDDFKEEFPYQLVRDISDYCFDILKNKSGTTKLSITFQDIS
jgi:hypothetical protein